MFSKRDEVIKMKEIKKNTNIAECVKKGYAELIPTEEIENYDHLVFMHTQYLCRHPERDRTTCVHRLLGFNDTHLSSFDHYCCVYKDVAPINLNGNYLQ